MIGSFKKSKWTSAVLAVVLLAAVALIGLTGCSKTAGTSTPDSTVTGSPADTTSPDTSAKPSDNASETAMPDGTPSPVSTNEPANPSPAESPYPSMVPQPSAGYSGEPSPAAGPTAAAIKPYLGDWTVSKVLAYGAAGTYSKADAEKMIGETLRFSEDEATIINDQPASSPAVFKNPKYEEGLISSGNFLTDFGISFATMGITTDHVSKVNVSVPDAGVCTLLFRDDGNLILIAGGTYFELAGA